MARASRALSVILCVALLPRLAWALDPERAVTQYAMRVWSSEQGLPQNAVTAIAQAPDGHLWLGTQEGVVRFDGTSFRWFDDRTGIAHRNASVQALVVASDGTVWFGTKGGLNTLRDGRFAVVPLAEPVVVSALFQDDDGVIWVGTSAGLGRIDQGRVVAVTLPSVLARNAVEVIVPAAGGGIWIGTPAGIGRMRGGSVDRVMTPADGLPASVRALLDTPDEGLWVGTAAEGVARLKNGRVERFDEPRGPGSPRVRSLGRDRHGAIWVGTVNGVSRYARGRFERFSPAQGFPHCCVVSVFEDREGTLWLGTFGGGLVSLTDGALVTFGLVEGVTDPDAFVVRETRDGSLWFGVGDQGGLDRMSAGRITHYSTTEGLPDNTVNTIGESPDGAVFVGTARGVARLSGERFTADDINARIGVRNVLAMHWASDGTWWIGTMEAGVFAVTADRVVAYSTRTGLPDDQIQSIRDAPGGGVWLATYRGGLVHVGAGAIRRVGTAEGLLTNFIRTLAIDADGTVWIGTNGAGLQSLRHGRVVAYKTTAGMCDRQVFAILDDGLGRLWLTSNHGVCRVSRRDLDAFARGAIAEVPAVEFGVADGMRAAECNGGGDPSGWRDRLGYLWIPTIQGVVRIDPARSDVVAAPPSIQIDDVAVDGRSTPVAGVVDVRGGGQDLRFEYAGLSLRTPHRLRYRYQLAGLDREWREAGTSRQAYYSRLPPGAYEFRVVAVGVNGVTSARAATVRVVVRRAYYETAWFWGLVACGLGALVVVAHVARTAHLRSRARLLQRAVRDRTAVIDAQRDEAMRTTADLRAALEQVKRLEGLLHICAYCKSIQTNPDSWEQLEKYVTDHSEAHFSHTICPTCYERYVRPELDAMERRDAVGDGPTGPASDRP